MHSSIDEVPRRTYWFSMSPRRRKESRGYVRQTVRENFLFSFNKTVLIQVSKKYEKMKKILEKIILGGIILRVYVFFMRQQIRTNRKFQKNPDNSGQIRKNRQFRKNRKLGQFRTNPENSGQIRTIRTNNKSGKIRTIPENSYNSDKSGKFGKFR